MNERDGRWRLLVLHGGALGDCVLTLQVVNAVKRERGTAIVSMAARSPIVRWACRHGLIDHACLIDEFGLHRLQDESPNPDGGGGVQRADGRQVSFERCLSEFDQIVSFLGDCAEMVNVRLGRSARKKVIAVDPRPRAATLDQRKHITRQWVVDLSDQGLNVGEVFGVSVAFPVEHRCRLRSALRERVALSQDCGIALIHPGSGGKAKCCPLDALEAVAGRVRSFAYDVVWMVGPDEMERDGPELTARLRRSGAVVYDESVENAADLVAGADLFIGNDAGMTHVASMAGVRTIAFFGPTDARVWRPLGRCVSVAPFPDGDSENPVWMDTIVNSVNNRMDAASERVPRQIIEKREKRAAMS